MLKMMIVDDESIERNALRLIIERFVPGVTIVGEAENGRVAIELAEKLQPDLMTMDIKMPGYDGIEAVEILNRKFPRMQFIMVSAFDEFEYARRVMKYGVKEYLLKPCKKEQIVNAINNVVEEIEQTHEERKRISELELQVEKASAVMESEWVSDILMNRTNDIQLEVWKQSLGFDMDRGGYSIIVTMGALQGELDESTRKEIQGWIRCEMKRNESCLVGSMIGQCIPIFIFPEYLNDGRKQLARSLAAQLIRTVNLHFDREFPRMYLSFGVGSLRYPISQLVHSYHEALLASQTPTASKVSFYEEIPVSESTFHSYPHECERQLLREVKQGNVEQSLFEFEFYMSGLIQATGYDLTRVKHDLHKLFSQIGLHLQELGIPTQAVNEFQLIHDEHSLRSHASFQLRVLVEKLSNWYAEEQRGSIEKAIAYLSENFAKELSLEEVAEHARLNPHYFSKLFHDRCGVTFIDYLTYLRIDRARELLTDQKQILKEISTQVGYRDPNYFSRVFKKTVGMSPTEYRVSMLLQ